MNNQQNLGGCCGDLEVASLHGADIDLVREDDRHSIFATSARQSKPTDHSNYWCFLYHTKELSS